MKKHVIRPVLIFAGVLLMTVPYMAASDQAPTSGSAVHQPIAAVLKFAVQSQSIPATGALSLQACPQDQGADSTVGTSAAVAESAKNPMIDPKLLDAISAELQRDFSKEKISVLVDPDPDAIPVGGQIISGCIFHAQRGSVAKRMVGVGWGASQIGAHVVVLSKTKTGFSPLESFDVQAQGRNILPPIGPAGLAIHAARQPRETLSADAKKLAQQIVTELDERTKQ